MSFTTDIKEELSKLKIWDSNSQLKQEDQIERIHIRECFYKAGFMNEPEKEYHLEIVVKTKKKALEILEILNKNGINAKIIRKKKRAYYIFKRGPNNFRFSSIYWSYRGSS